MKEVADYLVSNLGFSRTRFDKLKGSTYQKDGYTLSVTSGWAGRWEEFLCFKLEKDGDEVFSINYQVDTEGYKSKPKIYSAKEINHDLKRKLEEVEV
ncbi:hypothetical protein [Microbulbifer sp. SSSA005]|uniref:hypothetical protein n=1 Tax=Microbulbifer sp. SSSA005 TaxID=3243378 RepID=UPI004039DA36